MNVHGLLNGAELRWVGAAVAAASNTDQNSSRIDMTDYESALFLVPITDSAQTGVATLKIEENDADSDTGMTAITGASATKTSLANDDLNNKLLAVELINPSKRYVQGVITSATANIAFGETIVMLRPRRFPAEQGATVLASTIKAL